MSHDDATTAPPGMTIPPKPPLPPLSSPPSSSSSSSLSSRGPDVPLPPGWRIAVPEPPATRRRTRAGDTGGRTPASLWGDARVWLIAYIVLLAGIAFWPVPVDSGAGRLLRAITRVFPVLTYPRIEFGANILLFVPLGLLLALILARRRYLVLPIALIVTVTIEGVQGVLLGARTSSVLDVIANATGACVGLVLAEIIAAVRRRAREDSPPSG